MKEKTSKRQSELLRLYSEGAPNRPKFKIKNSPKLTSQQESTTTPPITRWELLRSLVLTFVIVLIQWLISYIVL